LKDLHVEPGAEDLVESPAMRPYVNFALAMMQELGLGPAKKEIAALPLEERYVWRVASALTCSRSPARSRAARFESQLGPAAS
jgi:hypothetical protein